MYPEISTVVANQTKDARIEQADRARRARRARPAASRAHHLPRVGSAFRQWLAAGLL